MHFDYLRYIWEIRYKECIVPTERYVSKNHKGNWGFRKPSPWSGEVSVDSYGEGRAPDRGRGWGFFYEAHLPSLTPDQNLVVFFLLCLVLRDCFFSGAWYFHSESISPKMGVRGRAGGWGWGGHLTLGRRLVIRLCCGSVWAKCKQ